MHELQRALAQARGIIGSGCLERRLHQRWIVELHALIGKGGPVDVAAHLFQPPADMWLDPDRIMPAEAVDDPRR
jgi:hypothetical protein